MEQPLCIDLCCGLGGWARGFLDAGYRVVGFDIEPLPYPGQLIIQDVRTLDGSRFRGATIIVASPPCTEFSRLSQLGVFPQDRGRQPDMSIVTACFGVARDAGVPLVLENVRGAEPYIGRAITHYHAQYLWGDGVPALLPTGRFEPKRHTPWIDRATKARERAIVPYELARWLADIFHPNSIERRRIHAIQPTDTLYG